MAEMGKKWRLQGIYKGGAKKEEEKRKQKKRKQYNHRG